MSELKELITKADNLFVHKDGKPRLYTYDYTLGRFPYGWNFSVVNSWQKWLKKGLTHEFGVYQELEQAIWAFLNYVEQNEIDVAKLMDRD